MNLSDKGNDPDQGIPKYPWLNDIIHLCFPLKRKISSLFKQALGLEEVCALLLNF